MRLVFAGEALVDVVMRVPALPERGGDVLADYSELAAGGGFNVMAAAARQGLPVVYAGGHGTGPWGDLVRAALESEGIGFLRARDIERDTGFDVALVESSGERTFFTSLGAEIPRGPDAWDQVRPGPGDAVYISGYGLAAPEPLPSDLPASDSLASDAPASDPPASDAPALDPPALGPPPSDVPARTSGAQDPGAPGSRPPGPVAPGSDPGSGVPGPGPSGSGAPGSDPLGSGVLGSGVRGSGARDSGAVSSAAVLGGGGPGAVLGAWAAALPDEVLLFVDPGPLVADIPAEVLDLVLARCDWWSCNQREATLLTGATDPAEAATRLLARAARVGSAASADPVALADSAASPGSVASGDSAVGTAGAARVDSAVGSARVGSVVGGRSGGVIVRVGPAGCVLALRDAEGSAPVLIPAPAVEVVDSTGAGDAHCGVFLAALAAGLDPAAAARRANAAAALAVTRYGPATAPSRAELDAWLDAG